MPGVARAFVPLVVAVHAILLFNALVHHPRVGYDADRHLDYARVLGRGSLPGPRDTYQYHSPPLPYAVPAAVLASGIVDVPGTAKVFQIQNVLCSLGVFLGIRRITAIIWPGSPLRLLWATALLAMVPVWYKSFAFVRGEPMLAFAVVGAVHGLLAIGIARHRSPVSFLTLAAWIALALLSRQWGWALVPAAALWIGLLALRDPEPRRLLGGTALALAIAVVLGGWYQARLLVQFPGRTHSPVARADSIGLGNLPPGYFTALEPGKLARHPLWPAFDGRFWPSLYAETWGDYQAYWVVWGIDHGRGNTPLAGTNLWRAVATAPGTTTTNWNRIGPFLGRVAVASIVPAAILLVGLFLGAASLTRMVATPPARERDGRALLALVVGGTFAGYLLWIVGYPIGGETSNVKATYLLQTFPLLAILGADVATKLRERAPRLHLALVALVVAVAVHNLPMLVTRHFTWRYG